VLLCTVCPRLDLRFKISGTSLALPDFTSTAKGP
jgi:hypothetical protein